MARSLTITYGGTSIGAGSVYDITEWYGWQQDYTSGTTTATVVVTGDDTEELRVRCNALEAAFRTPWQNLGIVLGGETFKSYSHSGNTGFNGEASIRKSASAADTALSREYTITVTVYFPADLSGQDGRRNASVNVAYAPSDRLTVSFSGQWTALDSDGALANFEANGESWATTWLGANFSGRTFERVGKEVRPDDPDKVASFSLVYQEVIFNETQATLNDPRIVGQSISISISRETPGDSPGRASSTGQPLRSEGRGTVVPSQGAIDSTRPYQVSATVACSVDKRQTTDLASVWEGVLRPYLIDLLTSVTGVAGSVAIINQGFTPEPSANTLTGNVTALVVGGGFLSYQVSLTYNDVSGANVVYAHGRRAETGYIVQGPRVLTRTINESYRRLAGASGQNRAVGSPIPNAQGAPSESVQIGANSSAPVPSEPIPAGAPRPLQAGIGITDFGLNGAGPAGVANLILGTIDAAFDDALGVLRGSFYAGGDSSGASIDPQAAANVSNDPGSDADFGLQVDRSGLQWVLLTSSQSSTPLTIGQLGRTIDVQDITTSVTHQAFIPARVSGSANPSGGGGAAGDSPPKTQVPETQGGR